MANGVFFSSLVRLYHSTFDRSSDIEGVGYWASRLAKGEMTFLEVAEAFMDSDEFKEQYGITDETPLSSEEFITLLYNNVLNREPDEEGLLYWVKVLEEGNLRSKVLVDFSESEEHQGLVEQEYPDELEEAELVESSLDDDDSDDDDSD
ncbi:MAG: DUF4214 domain-containing protein, partial [Neptuniibacter sp.]